MKKQLSIAASVGCLALMALFPSLTRADAITFNFTAGNNSSLTANANGLSTSANKLKLLTATDSLSNTVFSMLLKDATVKISTGKSTSFGVTGNQLTADYSAGAPNVIEVELTSDSCSTGSGAKTDVCLLGTENADQYSANKSGAGSFQGVFNLTYLDPIVLTKFGASGLSLVGSDALTTSANNFSGKPVNLDRATLAGGNITIETTTPHVVTPEPNSLLLLGTGLAGLAGLIRMKISQRS